MLERWQAERIPGAHCYEFYATTDVFHALADAEPGTFYLTDFLVRHFDRLVIEDLKLNTHPTNSKHRDPCCEVYNFAVAALCCEWVKKMERYMMRIKMNYQLALLFQ